MIDDERVVVWEDKRDWLAIVFDDYEKYRVDFVGKLTVGLYLISSFVDSFLVSQM